ALRIKVAISSCLVEEVEGLNPAALAAAEIDLPQHHRQQCLTGGGMDAGQDLVECHSLPSPRDIRLQPGAEILLPYPAQACRGDPACQGPKMRCDGYVLLRHL